MGKLSMDDYLKQIVFYEQLFDAFISSCYVGLRKPDKEIFHFACDIAQTKPSEALFIDDRQMFIEVAQSTGLNAIQFNNLEEVKEKIAMIRFRTA